MRFLKKAIVLFASISFLVLPDCSIAEKVSKEQLKESHIEKSSIEREELLLFFEKEELFVEAASRIKEPVSEAPAVVNIITKEDIKALGARNLLDILYTIPGFFDIQDINEHVVSLRGVYATSTHKILLLRDGHRLNDPLFEDIMPANSISLDSIKRIEVMRGPGASLYGNASLLGVINIITVDGDEPTKVSASIGNFGQTGFDLVYNKKLKENRQFLFFANLFNSDGEDISLGADKDFSQNPVAGGQDIDRRPLNYDLGIKYKGNKSLFTLSTRRSLYDTPRGNLGQFLAGDDNLVDPEQGLYNTNLGFQYLPEWKGIRFTLRHYLDYSRLISPQYSEVSRDAPPRGKAFNLELEDIRAGIDYSATFDHKKGNALLGFQVEALSLLDSVIETSFDDRETLKSKKPLPEDTEWNAAVYVQEKYILSPPITLNGGLRWSYYESSGDSFNPRIAIIYNPSGSLYAKAIYGRSFMAPGYFYRHENEGLGYGATGELKPEKMDTYQLSIENWFKKRGWIRTTLFRNRLKDLISRPQGASTYQNFGRLTTQGVETEVRLEINPFTLFANHSFIRPVKSKTDASLVKDDDLINIPRNIVNAGIIWRFRERLYGSLYGSWHDRIKSPIGTSSTLYRYEPDNEIPDGVILNLTINVDDLIYRGVNGALKIHNLLDRRDWRGGTVRIPYPQEGRSILFTLEKRF